MSEERKKTFSLLRQHLEAQNCVLANANDCLNGSELWFNKVIFQAPQLSMSTIIFLIHFCEQKQVFFNISGHYLPTRATEAKEGIFITFIL